MEENNVNNQNDIEKIIKNKSTTLTLVFFEIALLAYSIYTLVKTGDLGGPFYIFMAGMVIYFASNLFYKRKVK